MENKSGSVVGHAGIYFEGGAEWVWARYEASAIVMSIGARFLRDLWRFFPCGAAVTWDFVVSVSLCRNGDGLSSSQSEHRQTQPSSQYKSP